MSTFRSTVASVNSTYPVSAYSPQMYAEYAGWYDELGAWLKAAEAPGFYADSGGYGWYYASNGDLDMVFAPGGGARITYNKTHPKWQAIFDKIVKGKKAVTKETLAVLCAPQNGKETTGRAVAPTATPAAVTQDNKIGTPPAPELEDVPFYQKSWFIPAVGVATGVAVLAVVFWPSPKKANPKSKKRKKRSR
jgi:hypothetical protein